MAKGQYQVRVQLVGSDPGWKTVSVHDTFGGAAKKLAKYSFGGSSGSYFIADTHSSKCWMGCPPVEEDIGERRLLRERSQ